MNDTSVRILGHRGGAAGRYPENSIPAFLDGRAAGADVLELDVRLSRDGRVVVIHDDRIDRVSDGSGAVHSLGAAELRRVRLLDPNGVPHDGVHIPVLEEVMEACGDTPLNIDLKSADHELARAVAEILRRYDAVARTTVASFIPAALQFFRSIAPEVETSAAPDEVRALLGAFLRRERPTTPAHRVQIPPRHGLIPLTWRGFIRYLHAVDLAVDVWTINAPEVAVRLAARGVDGIVTDDVRTIRTALEKHHHADT